MNTSTTYSKIPVKKFIMSWINNLFIYERYTWGKSYFESVKNMKKTSFLLLVAAIALGGCSHQTAEPLYQPHQVAPQPNAQDMARYKENIVLKQHGKDFVSYEYRNVRIDELAPLAINYCLDNTDGKKAYLREIVMRENHAKLATFDCIDLQ